MLSVSLHADAPLYTRLVHPQPATRPFGQAGWEETVSEMATTLPG